MMLFQSQTICTFTNFSEQFYLLNNLGSLSLGQGPADVLESHASTQTLPREGPGRRRREQKVMGGAKVQGSGPDM